MIEYNYKKRERKFTENGHTMFEFDVLQRLKRLAYLEEIISKEKSIKDDNLNLDNIAKSEVEKYYGSEDVNSKEECIQGEITISIDWYKSGFKDALKMFKNIEI